MPEPRISIVITTRNRQAELKRALSSCEAQTGVAFEVLVYDDASEDETELMMRSSFPKFRLIRSTERTGYITLRNRGFHDAQGEFVLSLDDDAYLTHPETLSQICQLFAQYPQTVAWALRYYEPTKDMKMHSIPHAAPIRSYVGCAHVVRREIVKQQGGYPELLVHQGEERDLCIRLMNQGWDIRFAETPPIVHMCSPFRENWRMFYYGYRNLVLFNWMRTPLKYLPSRLAIDIGQLTVYRFQIKTIPSKIWCFGAGFLNILRYFSQRQPVSVQTYLNYRKLPGHGPSTQPDNTTPPPCTPHSLHVTGL